MTIKATITAVATTISVTTITCFTTAASFTIMAIFVPFTLFNSVITNAKVLITSRSTVIIFTISIKV